MTKQEFELKYTADLEEEWSETKGFMTWDAFVDWAYSRFKGDSND